MSAREQQQQPLHQHSIGSADTAKYLLFARARSPHPPNPTPSSTSFPPPPPPLSFRPLFLIEHLIFLPPSLPPKSVCVSLFVPNEPHAFENKPSTLNLEGRTRGYSTHSTAYFVVIPHTCRAPSKGLIKIFSGEKYFKEISYISSPSHIHCFFCPPSIERE